MNDAMGDARHADTWREMLAREHRGATAVLAGGVLVFSIAAFVVTTTLPSVVGEVGGLSWYAWSTTAYVVAALFAGTVTPGLLARSGSRRAYRVAMALFAAGTLVCALAPAMGWFLAGRLVEGFGGGMLSALSLAMVRTLFPRPLWSRAMAVISITWGGSTALGPAIGGLFADAGHWRGAFIALACLVVILWVAAERALPGTGHGSAPRRPAWGRLALLVASALAVALGGAASAWQWSLLGLIVAAGGVAWFHASESSHPRLLPRGALDLTGGLARVYAAQAFLLIAVVTEIFVPWFLQTLRGLSPLEAGYMSALMAAGWTLGSLASAGADGSRRRLATVLGPMTQFLALVGLALLLGRHGAGTLLAIAAALLALGAGIGLCWPQLGALVFQTAPRAERERAAGAITVVIGLANAFGSALAGMAANLGGIAVPGHAAHAAMVLFGGFALAPALALIAILGLRQQEGAP